MLYYLVRAGGEPRLMPEIPPKSWLHHMKELEYEFNTSEFPQHTGSTSTDSFLQPSPDSSQAIEANYLKYFDAEINAYNMAAARLMGNFMLFADPYIPIQSSDAFK
eukprot:Selendium_serpulae@DN6375_c0_g1_i20.p2